MAFVVMIRIINYINDGHRAAASNRCIVCVFDGRVCTRPTAEELVDEMRIITHVNMILWNTVMKIHAPAGNNVAGLLMQSPGRVFSRALFWEIFYFSSFIIFRISTLPVTAALISKSDEESKIELYQLTDIRKQWCSPTLTYSGFDTSSPLPFTLQPLLGPPTHLHPAFCPPSTLHSPLLPSTHPPPPISPTHPPTLPPPNPVVRSEFGSIKQQTLKVNPL